MKCFIIIFNDIFEVEEFKKLISTKNGIAEINYQGRVLKFLVSEPNIIYKPFFELDRIRKENKLSGILVLSIGFDLEKFIRNAKLFGYEIFVIKMKEIILPNNEIVFEYRAKNFSEILTLISYF